jgi:hypothetical protein
MLDWNARRATATFDAPLSNHTFFVYRAQSEDRLIYSRSTLRKAPNGKQRSFSLMKK